MSEAIEYYEIQSEIDPRFGAKIYPHDVFGWGSGWHLMKMEGKEALSPNDMRKLTTEEVVVELRTECRRLHNKTDHGY